MAGALAAPTGLAADNATLRPGIPASRTAVTTGESILADFISVPTFWRSHSGWNGRRRRSIVTIEASGDAAYGHGFTRTVNIISFYRLSSPIGPDASHLQVINVDDALQFSHAVKEIKHLIVGAIEIDFKGNLGIELAGKNRLGGKAANFHAGLAGAVLHDVDELGRLFLVGNNGLLDFELLPQAGDLRFQFSGLGLVLLQLIVLGEPFIELLLGRIIVGLHGLEDHEIRSYGDKDGHADN